MIEKPLIAILDNNDQLLCVTKDYFDSNLHPFLQGTAAFFSCSVLQRSEMSQYFKVGNKISFVYDETAYHFDITDMVKNEMYVTIQADTLTLELRNEDSAEYKATKAMTFEEYLKVFLFAPDNPTVMGINEVSDKKLKLEWEGNEESVLARLFSLANKFDAEIEFVTKLNRHWGLENIVLNVYKANDDKNQGIGKNRQDIILEYGNNVETIEIHENIDNLKTSIKPIGKDGLTVKNVVIDEKDDNGNRLFYSPKGDHVIRAVQARNQFISKVGGEGYIAKNWSYETDNANTLAGQALAELKKLSKVELTVTIKAYEKLNIGDTVRVQNKAYQPTLNLSVRVSEQDIYFEEPSKNTTTFTNVEILKSEVDASLLSRVQELIKANKKYEYQIISDNGTVFKNNQGQTTLTARVLDGVKDITDDLILSWSKDGKAIGSNKELIVNASEVIDKAVYRYDVADETGLVIGGYEVTVTNVNDGKEGTPGEKGDPGKDGINGSSSVLHTVWATDIYGSDIVKYPPKPNLASNTDFTKGWSLYNPESKTASNISGGIASFTKSAITSGRPVFLYSFPKNILKVNTTYITSVEVYVTAGSSYAGDVASFFHRNPEGLPFDTCNAVIPKTTPTNTWIKIVGPAETITKIGNNSSYIGLGISADFVGTIKMRNPKFEISDYATPFIKNVDETGYVLPKYRFIGTYSDISTTQSMDPSKYAWSDIGADDGKDGVGIPGTPGSDGKTPILHTAYAFSEDGSKWFSNKYPRPNLFRDYFVYKQPTIGKHGLLDYTIREAWAAIFIPSSRIKELLKPSTTYSIQYTFELLTRTANTTPFTQSAHGTLLLYNPTLSTSISLGGTANNVPDANTWQNGTTRTRKATFKTPEDLTGWMILCYTMRSMSGSTLVRLERGRFFDIKIEESGNNLADNTTGIVANPQDSVYYSKPMYTGSYVDYNTNDSNDPKDYTWVQNRGDNYIHVAYSNTEDKTDMVTEWPRSNILPTQPSIASNDGTNYPISVTTMVENGIAFRRVKRTSPEKNTGVLSVYNAMIIDPAKYGGKRLGLSFVARADKAYTTNIMDYAQNPQNVTQPNFDHYYTDVIGTEWKTFSTIFESWPSDSAIMRYINFQLNGPNANTSYVDYRDWKVEILEPGQEPTPYYPYGKEISFKYMGTYTDTQLESSTDPAKYAWNKWKGEPGPPMFTWIAYADDEKGTNISLSSVGKKYIGIASNKLSETPVLTPSLYKWSELGNQAALDALGNAVGNIPRTFVQSSIPSGAKNGDQWWVMSNNTISGYKIYGDGTWYPQKIDQAILNITQLNSVLINAATINGSVINNSYDVDVPSSPGMKLTGAITLGGSTMTNEGRSYTSAGVVNTYENSLSLDQLKMVSYSGGSKAKPVGLAQLSPYGLELVDPELGYKGSLTPEQLTSKPWLTLPLASDYSTAEGATPQYRKIQNLNGSYSVEIRGRAKVNSGNIPASRGIVVATLPAGCRPSRLAMFPVAFSGANIGRVQIELNGDMIIQIRDSNTTTVMLDGIILPL